MNTPLPLPAVEPGRISLASAAALLDVGVKNWKEAAFSDDAEPPYKGYDPFLFHRENDDRAGYSRFRKEFGCPAEAPDFPGLPSDADGEITLAPGNGGWDVARVVTIHRPAVGMPCGWYSPPLVPDGVPITIGAPHGDYLQATCPKGQGDWTAAHKNGALTRDWSFVLTYEGPDRGWILASCFPGEPDPEPDMSGLKAGDVIDAAEARRRHLRVKEV